MMKRKCENCIWFDQCNESEVCDNYDPESPEEHETMDVEAYNADLRARAKHYQRQIEEQDK